MATQISKTKDEVAVIIVPFPMHGHLNEALHLAHIITYYDIPVHYAGYTPYNCLAQLRFHGRHPESLTNNHFHDLQLPSITEIDIPHPSSEHDTENNFPKHLQPLFDLSVHLRQPIFRLLKNLSSEFRRIVVIHDTLMSSVVQDVKLIKNADTFALHSVSAFTVFFYLWESLTEKPFQLDSDVVPQNVPSFEGCFTTEFVATQHKVLNFVNGRLYNTSRLIEGQYMDLLEKLPVNANKKLFAIGPLNPVQKIKNTANCNENRHKCLQWLDKQEATSVIYISFGTSTTMTDDQIKELALGLEKSGQKFIWVLRNADKLDPSGVVDEVGVMVRESVDEGSVSRLEMDSFVAHITR